MRNVILLGFALAVLLSGCSTAPSAGFDVVNGTALSGETVEFTNTSVDANSYTWNFGDGTGSTSESPTHIFTSSGTYTVSLSAFSKNEKKSDEYSAEVVIGASAIEAANAKIMTSWSLDSLTMTKPGGPNYSWQLADLWGGTNEYLNVFSAPNVFKSYRDGVEEFSGVYELTSPTELLLDNSLTAPVLELTDTKLTYQRPSVNDPNYTETWFFTKL
mgnify:CR=1 FL=1